MTKTLWKIQIKKDSLWIKWINHIYGSRDIWDWPGNKDNSPLIKQLLQIRDTLASRFGSITAAMIGLNSWFQGGLGLNGAYKFFMQSTGKWPWKPIIWKNCLVPKHRFTTWLLAHGKLLTKDRQPYIQDKSCGLCYVHMESTAHLFFECPIALAVWNNIRDWLGMKKNMRSVSSTLTAFRGIYRGNTRLARLRIMGLAATVYQIWNLRNRSIFENEDPDIDATTRKIQITILRCIS